MSCPILVLVKVKQMWQTPIVILLGQGDFGLSDAQVRLAPCIYARPVTHTRPKVRPYKADNQYSMGLAFRV